MKKAKKLDLTGDRALSSKEAKSLERWWRTRRWDVDKTPAYRRGGKSFVHMTATREKTEHALHFKKWLESVSGPMAGVPSQFVLPGGIVRLYRYSHGDRGETYLIDPKRAAGKAHGYSRNDFNRSSKPRTFFYLDIDEKEGLVGNHLYVAEFPADRIYNIIQDPLGFKEETRLVGTNYDFDKMFGLIEEAGYDGVYYKPGFHVVNLFVPVEGRAATEEEVRGKKIA